MIARYSASFLVLGLAGVSVAVAPSSAAAVELKPDQQQWVMPRTPDGRPDLQGNWSNATLTPIQRPEGSDPVLTWEDVATMEGRRQGLIDVTSAASDPDREAPEAGGGVGGVWEGNRGGGVDGGSERRRKDTVFGQITLKSVKLPPGAEPPLVAPNPPLPPLILGPVAELGRDRFFRYLRFRRPYGRAAGGRGVGGAGRRGAGASAGAGRRSPPKGGGRRARRSEAAAAAGEEEGRGGGGGAARARRQASARKGGGY